MISIPFVSTSRLRLGILLAIMAVGLSASAQSPATDTSLSILPYPKQLVATNVPFAIDSSTRIVVDPDASQGTYVELTGQ